MQNKIAKKLKRCKPRKSKTKRQQENVNREENAKSKQETEKPKKEKGNKLRQMEGESRCEPDMPERDMERSLFKLPTFHSVFPEIFQQAENLFAFALKSSGAT